MGCVIDHLRADYRVRVLSDFVDRRRTRVHAGEEGVIRGMDVDLHRNEIWIEWERNGARQRLLFELAAEHGPGNGRMRKYFELGPYVPEKRQTGAPAVESALPSSRRAQSQTELAPGGRPGEGLPMGTPASGTAVSCDCDPHFHRLLIGASDPGLNGCLRCGTVTCTRCVGDDGRFSGEAFTAYLPVDVPPVVMRWLEYWPRMKVDYAGAPSRWPMAAELVRYPAIFYPANLRCADRQQLVQAEERLAREQVGLSRVMAIRRAGYPEGPPPAAASDRFQGLVDLWTALHLNAENDLDTLVHLAQLRNPASAVAVDLLLRRADALEILERALASDNPIWRSAGIAMARDFRGAGSRLPQILLAAMERESIEPSSEVPGRVAGWQGIESLLVAVADLRLRSPEMIDHLVRWHRSLMRRDDQLTHAIGVVLGEIGQGPASGLAAPGISSQVGATDRIKS